MSKIDEMIGQQLSFLLHDPNFQKLESTWRGLRYLCDQANGINQNLVKIKILTLSWDELARDLNKAIEFDQSHLFNKIYSQEFGSPGGEPFGLLIGDYYITHHNKERVSSSELLRGIAKIAAAAFMPFITSIDPSLLGLTEFSQPHRLLNLERLFRQAEYTRWKAIREDEDMRFVNLVLPQTLVRLPYQYENSLSYPFPFTEKIDKQSDYLWGNAVYCLADIIIRAFSQSGWFTDIRGAHKKKQGGIINPFVKYRFYNDHTQLDYIAPVNFFINRQLEKDFNQQGYIVLSSCTITQDLIFYDCPSFQKPQVCTDKNASLQSKLSTMLHYLLSVSRFAHCLKILARDKLGRFYSSQECEKYLQDWLHQYTASSSDLSDELKAKYPLRFAKISVYERLGSPGHYMCNIRLSPHYQFDYMETYLEFKTELTPTH